jgi:hypothetical protein
MDPGVFPLVAKHAGSTWGTRGTRHPTSVPEVPPPTRVPGVRWDHRQYRCLCGSWGDRGRVCSDEFGFHTCGQVTE